MRRATSLLILVTGLAAAVLCSILTSTAAMAQVRDMGNASDTINPFSPRYNHPYRHGVVPTREAHARMRAWADTNRPQNPSVLNGKVTGAEAAALARAAATGSKTLSFMGGIDGIGVTSGAPKIYLIFWGSQWGTQSTDTNGNLTFTGDGANAAPYMQQWIKGLGTNGELWSGVMTQYCDGPLVATYATSCSSGAPHVGYPNGDVLAGVWYDNSSAAPTNASGHQIAVEAVNAAAHFGNTTPESNRYVQYFIVSPSGTFPDGFNTPNGGFCAWHDFNGDTTLTGGSATSNYGDIAFTNMPYVADMGASCGQYFVSSALDGYSIVGGHEYAETITDQNPAGGWINIGTTYSGYENGDECAWILFGQGASALVAMSTGSFAMQSTWSNDTNRCDISHAVVTDAGGGQPTANFTVATSGLTASFTDTSTDSGGTISAYAWDFGDSSTSSATSPSHTYASAGTYTVTEVVTDSVSGATSTKTKSVTVSVSGATPSASFTFVANGLAVAFTDTSTDPGGTISSWSWAFGDGKTATSASPSHTYSRAGTYTVSLTVKDGGSGKTSSKSTSVTVTTSQQLIVDGGFENGNSYAPWTLTTGVLCSNSTCTSESAHSGTWFASLDGYGSSHTDTLSQTLSIPSSARSATLSFYLHIDTKELLTTTHDTLKVQVFKGNNLAATLATYSNRNAASGYSLKSFNLNSYIGKAITIKFTGVEDSSLATTFVIDDVSLTTN